MSLPIDDQKLILGANDSVSSITKRSSSTPSRGSLGRGRQAFTQHRDKRKVMFKEQQSERYDAVLDVVFQILDERRHEQSSRPCGPRIT